MTLPLTKTLSPEDFEALAPELAIVDAHFTKEREQNPMRRWEYAMAIRAFETWLLRNHRPFHLAADIGGAGSPFHHAIDAITAPGTCLVIDPADPTRPYTVQQYLMKTQHPHLWDAAFCLSVLEHVDDLDEFLYHLSCLVAPGGLLFLTMDCWDGHGPDTAHFHWMRKRIFDPLDWQQTVYWPLQNREFTLLGEADWTYHGHQLFGSYSFASLALVKRS